MSRRRELTQNEIEALVGALDGAEAPGQRQALRQLCPCRSVCWDREAWEAIYHAHTTTTHARVRDAAAHALETLWQRAEALPEVAALVRDLVARGVDYRPASLHAPRARRHGLPRREIERCLAALQGEDEQACHDALETLCPCRNLVYDRTVWETIERIYLTAGGDGVRDQALHALATLKQRARRDPRSQALLRHLAGEEPPAQIDLPPPALPVPRPPRIRRSRANRRR